MLDYRTETFLTVCKTLNFTTAAKQLNITQPAVSQHIHFLEKQYNTILFNYKNVMHPTSAAVHAASRPAVPPPITTTLHGFFTFWFL